jgi:hypothetical protein
LPDESVAPPCDVAIVSCDIIGHSSADMQHQLSRVIAINNIVAQMIAVCGDEDVVWASGGDGGHVAFRQAEWCGYAIDLITQLRHWSAEARVPLRVTAHIGSVTDVRGADGRVQLVGGGINLAGWILTRGSSEGVVVSEAFRNAVQQARPMQRIVFHDSRILRDKNRNGQCLALMSIESDHSRWATPIEVGRNELSSALDRGAGWEVLYFAKRILQTNTEDAQACQAIKRLGPLQLTYQVDTAAGTRSATNPFLGYLEPSSLSEVVQLGQLVERQYNDVICRYDDEGDTMFVILRGEVGVYKPEGQESENTAEPAFTHREGEIVGELAFALGRKRTADLIALSDVALLSFNYKDISTRLPDTRSGQLAKERVSRFITRRALEHICHGAPYLLGYDRVGPLAFGRQSWQDTLATLDDDTRLIAVDRHKLKVAFRDLIPAVSADAGHGLYILTAGQLRGGVDGLKKIRGDSFPLLWVEIPDVLVMPKSSFDVETEPVKIVYIGAGGLAQLEPLKREALHNALRRAAASCYQFDAFISYNSLDEPTARKWADTLHQKGLKVYIDAPKSGTEFPSRLRAALLDSRAVIALISPNVMVRDPDQNWVARETRFHREYFDTARIFPIRLPGGQHEQIVPGFSPIDVGKNEDAAIEQVAYELIRLRDGEEDPPYSLRDKDELMLS